MYFLIFLNFFDPLWKNWPLPHNRTLLQNQIFQNTRFFPKFLIPSFWRRLCMLRYFFQRSWWPKNAAIWLGKTHNWPHQNKISSLTSYLSLIIIFMQKIKDIYWFIPVILWITESCNLTGKEAHLPTSSHKWYSQMLPYIKTKLSTVFFPDILMIKKFCNLIGWVPHIVMHLEIFRHTVFWKLLSGWLSCTQTLHIARSIIVQTPTYERGPRSSSNLAIKVEM